MTGTNLTHFWIITPLSRWSLTQLLPVFSAGRCWFQGPEIPTTDHSIPQACDKRIVSDLIQKAVRHIGGFWGGRYYDLYDCYQVWKIFIGRVFMWPPLYIAIPASCVILLRQIWNLHTIWTIPTSCGWFPMSYREEYWFQSALNSHLTWVRIIASNAFRT